MVELPEDVLVKLAPELDRSSAKCLARTARCLRDLGERKVWENVTIGSKPDEHQVYSDKELIRLLRCVSSALTGYPARAEYIKRFRVAMPPRSSTSCDLLIEVLKLVSPYVQVLDLHLAPEAHVTHNVPVDSGLSAVDFAAQLLHAVRSWDKVTDLQLTGVSSTTCNLGALVSRCPRLRKLVLRPLNIPTHSPHSGDGSAPIPELPHLTTLAITPLLPPSPGPTLNLPPGMDKMAYKDLYQCYRDLLDALIGRTPNLDRLVLDGPHPLDSDALERIIQTLPRLRVLYLDERRWIDWHGKTQLPSGVKTLWLNLPGWPGARVEYLNTNPNSIFADVEHLILGCSSNAEADHRGKAAALLEDDALPTLRSAFEQYTSLQTVSVKLRSAAQDSRLLDGSSLAETIDDMSDLEGYARMARSDTIMRRYARPGLCYSPGLDLLHLRSFDTTQRGEWHDAATYRGLEVPLYVLEKMYESSCHSADWTTCDREATFGSDPEGVADGARAQAAWHVSDEWYLSAVKYRARSHK